MRIRIGEDEHQVTLKAKGNTIVGGRAVSWDGKLLEGVEDISVYKTEIDEDGNEVKVEIIPEIEDNLG
jgi:hypothetical protein